MNRISGVWHHCLVRRYELGQPASLLTGVDVMLVGLFSAKDKTVDARLDLLAATVEAHGGQVWVAKSRYGGAMIGFSLPALADVSSRP